MFFLKAITSRNFTMKGLHHGLFPANFEKFLRFLLKHPQGNTFVPFRPLWDFTTVLKTVTVFLLLHCGSCPCAAQRKQQSFGILNKQKPFTISGLELFYERACLKKKLNIHRKTGTDLENFERGGIKNFVTGWNMVT